MPKKPGKKKPLKVAKAVKKYVKNALLHDAELKSQDFIQGATNVGVWAAGTACVYLSGVTQGLDDTDRLGNWLKPMGYKMRMLFYPNNGVLSSIESVRVVIFQYASGRTAAVTTSAAPSIGNVIADSVPGGGGALTGNALSYSNIQNKKDYHILYDKTLVFSAQNAQNNSLTGKLLNINIPGKRMRKIQFNDTDGTVASSGPGGLWLIVMAQTTSIIQYISRGRLNFIDK